MIRRMFLFASVLFGTGIGTCSMLQSDAPEGWKENPQSIRGQTNVSFAVSPSGNALFFTAKGAGYQGHLPPRPEYAGCFASYRKQRFRDRRCGLARWQASAVFRDTGWQK